MIKSVRKWRIMENNEQVPYIVHEGILARMERIIRRLWIIILVLIALLVGSNIAWLIYESNYQTVRSYKVEQSTENGDNNDLVGIHIDGKTESDGCTD